MAVHTAVGRGRAPFGLTLLAVVYSLGLIAWVIALPAVDGETLLEHGGLASLAITAQPLLFSVVMWALLRRRCTTGSRMATVAAWALGPFTSPGVSSERSHSQPAPFRRRFSSCSPLR